MRSVTRANRVGMGIPVLAAGLLAAATVVGQGGPDTDGDGVPDDSDNCILIANGPLAQGPWAPRCDAQEDGDMDGYGNPCDGDFNQDFARGIDDLGEIYAASVQVSTDPQYDFNCDGGVGLDDVAQSFQWSVQLDVPGPSGHPCAGTTPCP